MYKQLGLVGASILMLVGSSYAEWISGTKGWKLTGDTLYTNPNERVGIGTTSPNEKLQIDAGGGESVNIKLHAYANLGNDYSAWSTILGSNVRARHGANSGMVLSSDYTGSGASAIRLRFANMYFHTASPSDISGYSEGTAFSFPRMTINSSGNVGIGTTNPTSKLHVIGDIHCTGKLTSDGGNDPPYVLYDRETRESIKERVAKEVPEDKLDGAVLFWNGKTLRFEVYLPARDEFRDIQGKLLTQIMR